MIKTLLITFSVLFFAGCSSLPYATQNKFNIGEVEIQTSRDSVIKDLEIEKKQDGTFKIKVQEYTATANAQALEVAKAEAQYKAQLLDTSQTTTKELIKALVETKTVQVKGETK